MANSSQAKRVRKEGQVLQQLPLLSHTPLGPGGDEVGVAHGRANEFNRQLGPNPMAQDRHTKDWSRTSTNRESEPHCANHTLQPTIR